MTTALIGNIQKYSIHDGPGIRTTVFFKGCPLLCAWCHNPESQIFSPELHWHAEKCIGCGDCVKACPEAALTLGANGVTIDMERCTQCGACSAICPTLAMERIGQVMTVEQVLAEVLKDTPFYEQSHGGVTLSGGEPLSQVGFTTALLQACKQHSLHTCVDTSGFVPQAAVEAAAPYTDIFLYDIKHLDPAMHQKYMGAGNEPILRNLRWLAESGSTVWVRVPFIPTINDSPEHIRAIGQLMRELNLKEIFLLPYHKLAQSKYQRLGLVYSLPQLDDAHEDEMQYAVELLTELGLNVHIGG